MTDELKNGITQVAGGSYEITTVPPPNDTILRYEVVVSRTVIVYAVDSVTAKARASQVDGVVGRYTVLSCALAPLEAEPRVPIIDRAPSRETQK